MNPANTFLYQYTTPMKPKLTKFQRHNLAKLTLWCWTNRRKLRGHFNMKVFWSEVEYPVDVPGEHSCGTAACFLGHGPMAGIKPWQSEGWRDYAKRCFAAANLDAGPMRILWLWLFSEHHPNSITQACKRAAWVLEGNEVGWFTSTRLQEDFKKFTPNWKFIEQLATSNP